MYCTFHSSDGHKSTYPRLKTLLRYPYLTTPYEEKEVKKWDNIRCIKKRIPPAKKSQYTSLPEES